MTKALFEDLGQGIFCIDALYTAPDIACCYLIDCGGEYAFIETGTTRSIENILATLEALGAPCEQVSHVIPTHVHLDHAGAAGALLKEFPEAQLLIHPRGLKHLLDPTRLVESATAVYGPEAFEKLYGQIQPADPQRTRALEDGETLVIGKRPLRVMFTRGHAEHHACFFDEQSQGWFTGDMFGVSYRRQRHAQGSFVMPATTPTQFDPDLYAASIDTLAAANPQRMYLTHYGALDFDPAQAVMLKQQLSRYAELGATPASSVGDIEAAVLDITRDSLRSLVDAETAAQETELLAMDAHLNAQGIAWWSNQPRP